MHTQSPQRRPSSTDRRGSVLIFVIGVLLLLSIIATAFLGTSRSDRTSTQQNAVNTQIDLLLEGVVNAAKGQIINDESVPGSETVENFDAITSGNGIAGSNDDWLASRAPTTWDPNSVYAGGSLNTLTTNPMWWPGITSPVLGDAFFESPYRPTAYGGSLMYTSRTMTLPAPSLYAVHAVPSFVNFGGKEWPAFVVDTSAAPTNNTDVPTRYQLFLGADADGDGVTDSGLFRIPIGDLAGVTYFGAVRIIDNGSAINLNTALSKYYSFEGRGRGTVQMNTDVAGVFPGDIGLAEALRSLNPTPTLNFEFDNMSTTISGAQEWDDFQAYRTQIKTATIRPSGVFGITSADVSPYDDTRISATAPVGNRADFQFRDIADMLNSQIGRRSGNPGVTRSISTATGKSAFVDSLSLASKFTLLSSYDFSVGAPLSSPNKLYAAMPWTLGYGPGGVQARTEPYTAQSGYGMDVWFRQNFDYLAENQGGPNPTTFMNRRTIFTGANAVGDRVGTEILPPAYLFTAQDPQWTGIPTPLVNRNPNAYAPYVDSLGATVPTLPMYVASLGNGATTATIAIDPKISINTGRFEELFYGYFKTMARGGFTGLADDFGTPYSGLFGTAIAARAGVAFDAATGFNSATGYYYADPYIGMRYTAGAFTTRNEPAGQMSVINGQTGVPEQHPLRHFRSVLRAPHDRSATPPPNGYWDVNTPRLPPDQVLILRAAIAAANLEALRDGSFDQARSIAGAFGYNNDRVIRHDIPLTAKIANLNTAVVAHVYGLKRQPYIAEVYVNTDTQPVPTNDKGYVAIKLYNPHPVPISLRYCRLVGLRRSVDTAMITNPATSTYPSMQVLDATTPVPPAYATTTDQIDLGTALSNITAGTFMPYVIPPNGTLILENYNSAGPGSVSDDAEHRPASTLLPPTGVITPADPAIINFAYVPGLQRVVLDREMVLMRPTNCLPAAAPAVPLEYTYPNGPTPTPTGTDISVINMVPLDSFDFTGLNVPDGSYPVRTRAEAWHYVRTLNSSVNRWTYVYPGRYDGNQSIQSAADVAAGLSPLPRQQGTFQAHDGTLVNGWVPGVDNDPWADPLIYPVAPPMYFNVASTSAVGLGATASYPDVFTIQLNSPLWPSFPNLHDYTATGAAPNRFPFGGFRRLGDMLESPFIGSYTIQTETDAALGTDTFLEINPVTMDAALAEDTDPADNELIADTGMQSREQIGRFVPLRPSYGVVGSNGNPAELVDDGAVDPNPKTWAFNSPTFEADFLRYRDDIIDPAATPPQLNRYAWTKGLFDHFTLESPHDDAMANYPTQPRWQKNTAYSIGDVVQYGPNAYVCRAAHVSSNSDTPPASEISPGVPADLSAQPVTYATPPVQTNDWQPLQRNAVSNSGQFAGNRSDLAASGRAFDFKNTNDTNETSEGIQGLVNINTAPEAVLALIPWLPQGDHLTFDFNGYPSATPTPLSGRVTGGSGDSIEDNRQIAHAIVLYRDGAYFHKADTTATNNLGFMTSNQSFTRGEPFTSIYDLYKVPMFAVAQQAMRQAIATATLTPLQSGDFSNVNGAAGAPGTLNDGVSYDFEEQTLLMNRVSNLITTRSDTFTIYALVQGWRNVGTANPQLVAQRRAAFIVDRSAATSLNKTLTTLSRVPTQ